MQTKEWDNFIKIEIRSGRLGTAGSPPHAPETSPS